MATLDLQNIIKRYETLQVIHGVDLHVADGDFCVFVGPSGCGKSTLLRMIAGLEQITSGEIRIDGTRMNETNAAGRGLAMVFQSYALYPHMTVRQNLSFGLENIKTPTADIATRVAEAARMLQIEPLLERRPGQLSGGQRQRVAIGRAVVREPKIFLFDEPLSNLDAELRVQMRVELADLHARLGNTMIYVTHDQTEAMTMADKIVVLRDGRIEQVGAPLDLYNHPANRFVAGFIGSPRMNFLEAILAGPASLGLEGVPAIELKSAVTSTSEGSALTYGIRPEHVRLVDQANGTIPATAVSVEQLGSDSYLYCELPAGQALTVHHPGQTSARRGDAVHLQFDAGAAHLFAENGEKLPM
ncbi:MAG: ABC transporter ATP-binding protein [Geminicoccales bacterium]